MSTNAIRNQDSIGCPYAPVPNSMTKDVMGENLNCQREIEGLYFFDEISSAD
jgi:hypothetical protein